MALRRCYLAGATNLYSFIRGLFEWPFSELFPSDALLWNQYKIFDFDIFSCKILIISCKILVITIISNETTDELTICANYVETSKYLNRCFKADENHRKITCSHSVIFNEDYFLCFWDNIHLFKNYPMKVPQNCFDLFNCSN